MEWLRSLGSIPNEYLHYYYFARETLAAVQAVEQTRGTFLLEQQSAFYAETAQRPDDALELWQKTRAERESTYMVESREVADAGERDERDMAAGGYEQVALSLMRAIAHNERASLILNVRNRGTLRHLDDDAVVEIPCTVDANGALPVTVSQFTDHQAGLVCAVKAVERSTIEAAATGSRAAAVRAFAWHPLIDSVTAAAPAPGRLRHPPARAWPRSAPDLARFAVDGPDWVAGVGIWQNGRLSPSGSVQPSNSTSRSAHPSGHPLSPRRRCSLNQTCIPKGDHTNVAVKIRLKRIGKKRAPHYRIVVMDARTKRDGRAIEEIGKYNPKAEPSFIHVESDRAQYWLGVGAQPTEAVEAIFKASGDWQKFKGLDGPGAAAGQGAEARQAGDLQRGPRRGARHAEDRGRHRKKTAAKKAAAEGRGTKAEAKADEAAREAELRTPRLTRPRCRGSRPADDAKA